MLRIEGLSVSYGGLHALAGVSLSVDAGRFVAIVGPNGAGKTTLFKAVSGTVPATAGDILFEGRSLLAMPPARRAHLGIAHVPEGRQVFRTLSVRENLEMGAHLATRRQKRETMERVLSLFPALKDVLPRTAGLLSGGQQQMAALARALMAQPRVLLLDEPLLGLAPAIQQTLVEAIGAIRALGVSVVVAEQYARPVLPCVDYAYILENGSATLEGTREELLGNPDVRAAYFGTG